MKKCIHVVNIGEKYLTKVKKITLPTIKKYAKFINADLNLITVRKYSEWPIVYEKMQVWDDGKGYDWNVLIDLDVIISPNFYDVTTKYSPDIVSFSHSYVASDLLRPDYYFLRDGRNVGVAANFVVTSLWTHDLWTPLDMSVDEALKNIASPHIVDEYCLSRNFARFGLKYAGVAPEPKDRKLFLHLGTFNEDENEMLKQGKKYINEYCI